MRKPVLVATLLSGALLLPALSPLGGTAAFADGSDPGSSPSTPVCPAPSGDALAVSGSTPTAVTSVGGSVSETIRLSASAWLVAGELQYRLTPPAGAPAPTSAPVVTGTYNGQGSFAPQVYPYGSGWVVSPPFGQIMAGSQLTIVLTISFTAGMPSGRYGASFEWDSSQNCDGVSSPGSATYVVSLPSLTYSPPSATQKSGGGASTGRATAGAAASSSASPTATATGLASQTAADSGADAPTSQPTPSTSGSSIAFNGTTAASSSTSDTTLMLAALLLVLLAAGAVSGFVLRRRRAPLPGASAVDAESAASSDAAGPSSPGDPDE